MGQIEYGGGKVSPKTFCFWSGRQGTYDNRVTNFAFPIPVEK